MMDNIYSLATFSAPEEVFGVRGLPKQTTVRHPDFWDGYDNNTLIYDCVWQAEKRFFAFTFRGQFNSLAC
jgi:hypothetical protein